MSTLPTALGVLVTPFVGAQPVLRKLRAAIYIRKSNKDDEGRTKSRDEQLAHCRRVAEMNGFEVSEDFIYVEPLGVKGEWFWKDDSGRYPEPYRPELTRMMRDAEAALFDVVLCWRSDRLFRDPGVAEALGDAFRRLGIRFICGVRDMDIGSASGRYGMTTEAATNRRWRDTISEDIKRDHEFKVQMGMFSRNPTCLGWRSKGLKSQDVEPVYEQLELVHLIFRLFVTGVDGEGPFGTLGVANYLMDKSIRWPKGLNGHEVRHPEFISHTQVRFVLTNCMHVGRWRHNGQEYEFDKLLIAVLDENGNPTGKRQTAVPIQLYEDAQAKLARNSKPGKRSLSTVHLTTGITVCARCGRPLIVHTPTPQKRKSGEPYMTPVRFRCRHGRGDRPCPPDSALGLQESVLDEWVQEELAPVLVAEMAAIRASAGREADQETLSRVERKLADVRKRETTQLAAMVDAFDREQCAAVAAHFRAQREGLVREANRLRERIERADRVMPDLSEDTLASQSREAIKDALSRALCFIAIGTKGTGVVALTKWGSYIAAPFRAGDPTRGEVSYKTFLGPATPAGTLGALGWFPAPPEFVLGRRESLGKTAEPLTDEELLPGVFVAEEHAGDEAVVEIEDPCLDAGEQEEGETA